MINSKHRTTHPAKLRSPIGLSLGLLAACLTTILCIFSGHEPETVLFRALIGGSFVALISSAAVSVVISVVTDQEEDD